MSDRSSAPFLVLLAGLLIFPAAARSAEPLPAAAKKPPTVINPPPTAQDWADATGTISYEIVTRVGARVPRAYRGRLP